MSVVDRPAPRSVGAELTSRALREAALLEAGARYHDRLHIIDAACKATLKSTGGQELLSYVIFMQSAVPSALAAACPVPVESPSSASSSMNKPTATSGSPLCSLLFQQQRSNVTLLAVQRMLQLLPLSLRQSKVQSLLLLTTVTVVPGLHLGRHRHRC